MKFKRENAAEILSIVGEGVEFVGELSFTHGIRVDGIVRGKIRSDSSMVIGAKGKVEADIAVRRVAINGEFHGVIHASDRVEIHREGKVYGDIYTPCLIIEAGALFEGKCNMDDHRAARAQGDGGGPAAQAAQAGSEKRA